MNKTVLKLILLCLSFLVMFSHTHGQTDSEIQLQEDNEKVLEWIEDLYEHGVSTSEDSISINKETHRLINDQSYRNEIYPTVYTWNKAMHFMASQELKKAFWYMLNLYLENDKNKDLVIKSILTYNSLFKMNEVMEATYKTYALLDPGIGKFNEGQFEITKPHMLESKLNALKEILYFIEKYSNE